MKLPYQVQSFLPKKISLQPIFCVDLGSQSVKVRSKNFSLVVPSCVIVDSQSGQVVSIGHEAVGKLGKLPSAQRAVFPIRNGVIADVPALQHIIECIFQRYTQDQKIFDMAFFPKIHLALPEESSEVEVAALKKCWRQVGVIQLEFFSNGVAAAVASGIRLDESQARVVVDIGATTTEIFIIGNGLCIAYRRILSGGQDWTQAIVRQVKHAHQVEISQHSAESIQRELGILHSDSQKKRVAATVVRGRHLESFSPSTVKVTQHDVTVAISPLLEKLTGSLKEIFSELPGSVVADVMKFGVFVTGGGALLPGLKEALAQLLEIEVWITDQPESAIVRGLEELES